MFHKIFRFYFVLILVIGLVTITAPQSAHAAGPWYVATTGDDNNDCLSSNSPCATINGAIGKATAGDTINVAIGTYTGSGTEVLLIDKNITLSGGWDSGFSTQSSFSTIDGQNARRGVFVANGVTAGLDRFIVTNGSIFDYGGGIYSNGDLNISNSSIHSNSIGNVSYGGGIFFNGTSMSIENSTVSNNSAGGNGGGVFSSQPSSTVTINNSTISNNRGGGLYNNGIFNLNNTIISGNEAEDCNGTPYTSQGNNIISNTTNCTITATNGDQFDVNPLLGTFLADRGYSPLLLNSPAIDAGNDSTCLSVDQRGVARPQGASCDIGAYERSTAPSDPAVGVSLGSGNNQRTPLLTAFPVALQVAALDAQGNPVSGVAIEFSAPASGPSGTFADTGTNTTSVNTDADGYATTIFTANDQAGSYTVSASATGLGTVFFNLEQFVAPANDNFANAEVITSLPFSATVDNTEASNEPGEPPGCGFPFRSVWYSFTAAENIAIRVDMTGSLVGGLAGIYLASGPGISDLTSVACVLSNRSSNFNVEAGKTYYLRVDGNGEQAGVLQVNLQQITPPANDNFANAEVIGSLPFTATVDNTNATAESDEPQGCGFPFRNVWYSFSPAENMTVRVDMTGSLVGGLADIYLASGPGISDLTSVACVLSNSSSNFNVEAGKTYYLRVDGNGEQAGVLQINLEQITSPANDNFANAEVIGSLPFTATVDNTNATAESGEPQGCDFPFRNVWYSFSPAENMTVRVDMDGSAVGGTVSIFLASGPGISDLTSVACALSNRSSNFNVEAGKTYYLRLDSFGQADVLQINLQQITPPANDNFANAEVIGSLPFSATVDNTNATAEPGEPPGCTFPFRSVWYSFSPAENMALRVSSPAGGAVSVFLASGATFSDLTFLACAHSGSSTNFQVDAGQTYYLVVESVGQPGILQFNLGQALPPANDNLTNAEVITSIPFSTTVDLSDATNEANEPQFCGFMPNTIWYSFTPTETIKLKVDTSSSPISTNVNIYRATGNGFPDLQFIQCSGFGGTATLLAEAGATYYFQAGGFGQAGAIQLNLTEMAAISGRVTDAVTGAPLPGDIEPFATAHLYRICGDGCLDFVNSQNTDSQGRFVFDSYYYGSPLPAGTYHITVTASLYPTGEFGPFDFSSSNLDVGDLPLMPPSVIRGRAVAADTGSPLPGASVTLRRCDAGGCSEFVNSQNTDNDGRFQFNSFNSGDPLPAGPYEVDISAMLYETQRVQATVGEGENRDLGDVLLQPFPLIGSISGRLLDAVTAKPISQSFGPSLILYRCEGEACSFVNSMVPDPEGRFGFETDYAGNRLITGSYRIYASADQYDPAQIDTLDVVENEKRSVGDIRLNSLPVRFSELQSCGGIPASGGECLFTVKISNGTSKNLSGKVWSLANSILPDSFAGYTNFQIKDPQDLDLGKGKSKVFSFRFNVPANMSTYGSFVCTRLFVGQGSQALFNTIGVRDLFCIYRNAGGFAIVSPQEALSSAQTNVTAAVTGTEIEPNNSCQTAQEVGAVSGSFVMDGNLDSSITPDVDFFRFSGTPSLAATIDLEGQSTGKGTLSDPFLGFFDSNCNLIALNDDSGTLNSHLEITIPADGIFILAATTCCDGEFLGGGNGSYQLTVAPLQYISSISGVVTDALNGKPLRGDAAPFAFVRLLRCDTSNCFDVNSQNAGSDGSFRFNTDSNGSALRVGDYRIVAQADQYQFIETETFAVGESEDYVVSRVALNSYPIRFSNTQVCTVPANGGLCDFSVKITNGLSTEFSGKAWSIIDGNNIGSLIGFTSFQAGLPTDISLASGKSMVLRFRFQVRGSVSNGANICATVFAGQNPDALFHTVGQRFLFCFTKGTNGFTLMSEQEMQSQLQHMPLLEVAPNPAPSLPKK